MNKEFWSDVLRSGAILGVAMSLSCIFERYIWAFSEMPLLQSSAIFCIEWLVAAVAFVWLLVRFTRRRADAIPSEIGVTYSHLLLFIIFASMLSGVLVGAVETLYISVMGYDTYILGFIDRIDQLQQMYIEMGIQDSEMQIFNEFTTLMRQMEQPSIFATVFNQLQTYAMVGCIPGFIIAAIISRRHCRIDVQK